MTRRVRITGSRPPEPFVIEELPEGIEEGRLFTGRRPPARDLPWLRLARRRRSGLRTGSVASFVLAALGALVLARRDGDAPAPPALCVAGLLGEDRIDCAGDIVTVRVNGSPAAAGGVAVAWIESGDSTLRLLLDAVDGGYAGYLFVADGAASTQLGVTGEQAALVAGASVLVRVDGVLQARRALVVGHPVPIDR